MRPLLSALADTYLFDRVVAAPCTSLGPTSPEANPQLFYASPDSAHTSLNGRPGYSIVSNLITKDKRCGQAGGRACRAPEVGPGGRVDGGRGAPTPTDTACLLPQFPVRAVHLHRLQPLHSWMQQVCSWRQPRRSAGRMQHNLQHP